MIRVGVIGAGRIAQLHAREIAASPDFQLTRVYDPSARAASDLVELYGGDVSEDSDSLIAGPYVDAVFICSPTETHVSLIAQAVSARRHVFCEKPLDLYIGSARRAVEILSSASQAFALGFHRRFDPSTEALRSSVAEGTLGNGEFMRVISRDPAPPSGSYIAHSGGIFRDMTIHDFDLCRWLSGHEFTYVFAVGFNQFDHDIEAAGDVDTAAVTLWNDQGFSAVIQNGRRSNSGFDQRLEIMGSLRTCSLANLPMTMVETLGPEGRFSEGNVDHFPERYSEAYRRQLAAFARQINGQQTQAADARDGFAALALAIAAQKSLETGQPVRVEPLPASN